MRSTLFEKINLNMSALLVPYQLDKFGRPTKAYAWEGRSFSLGAINYGSISLTTSFKSKKRVETKEDQEDPSPNSLVN